MYVEDYESLYLDDGYLVDSRGYFVVFCDGSSIGNHRKWARYSGVSSYWGPGRQTCTESQSSDPEDNGCQTAEARAVLLALR